MYLLFRKESKQRQAETEMHHLRAELEKVREKEIEARTTLEDTKKTHAAGMASLQEYANTIYANNKKFQQDKTSLVKSNQELQDTKRTLQEKVDSLESALRERDDAVRKARDAERAQVTQARDAELASVRAQVTQLTQSRETDQKELGSTRTQLAQARAELITLRDERAGSQSKYEKEVQDRKQDASKYTSKLESQETKHNGVCDDLAHQIAVLRAEMRKGRSVWEAERNAWNAQKEKLTDDNKRQQDGIAQLLLEQQKKVSELLVLKAKTKSLEDEIEGMRRNNNNNNNYKRPRSPSPPRIYNDDIKGENQNNNVDDEGFLSLL